MVLWKESTTAYIGSVVSVNRVKKLERINNVLSWITMLVVIFVVTTDNIFITLLGVALIITRGIIDVEIIQSLKRELMKREVRHYIPNDRGTYR